MPRWPVPAESGKGVYRDTSDGRVHRWVGGPHDGIPTVHPRGPSRARTDGGAIPGPTMGGDGGALQHERAGRILGSETAVGDVGGRLSREAWLDTATRLCFRSTANDAYSVAEGSPAHKGVSGSTNPKDRARPRKTSPFCADECDRDNPTRAGRAPSPPLRPSPHGFPGGVGSHCRAGRDCHPPSVPNRLTILGYARLSGVPNFAMNGDSPPPANTHDPSDVEGGPRHPMTAEGMVTAPTTPTGTLPVAPPNHSVEVLTRIETPTPGNAVREIVKGRVVAVFNSGNRLYASDAKCGHRQRPQEIGGVRDGIVTCPRHYAQFRLDNG